MSLFGEVIPRITDQIEPAATQALEYILNSSRTAAEAFLGVPAEVGISFECGGIYSEMGSVEGARPDLTVKDRDGNVRVLVENKFDAMLTDAQPVTYLESLPDGLPSALLFIVPERRVTGVWGELRGRCIDANLHLMDDGAISDIQWMRFGDNHFLLITSWGSILDRLQQDADGKLASEIQELRGLTDRMDQGAYLPLRADDVTDTELRRLVNNYRGLVEPIVERLRQEGIADTKRLNYAGTGRYLKIYGLGVWLGVGLDAWHDSGGITPLWCYVANHPFSGLGERWREVPRLFDKGDVVTYDGWRHCIPIRLQTGIEHDHAVDQMRIIAEKLRDLAAQD